MSNVQYISVTNRATGQTLRVEDPFPYSVFLARVRQVCPENSGIFPVFVSNNDVLDYDALVNYFRQYPYNIFRVETGPFGGRSFPCIIIIHRPRRGFPTKFESLTQKWEFATIVLFNNSANAPYVHPYSIGIGA
uniref:Uncharacterized protein n=1 Tax=Tetranychus urticae TaxID=32264 RepID=T1JQV9_TETUR